MFMELKKHHTINFTEKVVSSLSKFGHLLYNCFSKLYMIWVLKNAWSHWCISSHFLILKYISVPGNHKRGDITIAAHIVNV